LPVVRHPEPQGFPPGPWREALTARLAKGEAVLGWFAPDLDRELRYADGLVVLTDERVLAAGPEGQWSSWPLREIEEVHARDRAGVGTLELHGPGGRLAYWRYTAHGVAAAHALADRFEILRREGPDAAAGGVGTPGEEPDAPRLDSAPRLSSLLRLIGFARPHARAIVLGFFLTLATTVAGLVPPYLTMPLTDEILIPYQNRIQQAQQGRDPAARRAAVAAAREASHDDFRRVPWLLAGLGASAVVAWLFGWRQGYVMAWVSERIGADLRNKTYAHLQGLSLEFFGGKRTGDLIARISSDTDRICSFLSDNLVDFATDCLMIIGTVVILLTIDPVLALATLTTFPVLGWLMYRVRERLNAGFQRGGRAWAEMTSVLADTLPGIRVVKAFAQERREIERFRQANLHILRENDKVNSLWTFFWPLIVMLNSLGLLVVWAVGAWRVYEGRITVGVLSAFLTYIARFYTRLESMSRMMSNTQRAAASASRLFDILDRTPSVPDPPNPVRLGEVRGAIEFRAVSFRYGSRTVLHEVNLSVEPGEFIGLVGPSGAGKSTLVNLLCRFYDVTEGAVLVDGVDIRRLAVEDYRRNIGLVLQEPFLFFGTVAENIAYGKPNATRAEIVAAARAAKAHEFILRQPDGYDSLVGERGMSLSGGERQRISIARALLTDPAILILDEATSAVDVETEKEIQEALDNLTRGRTTIAIAHRLSTLRKADRLIVLEHGRLVEEGQHQDLIERGGTYARLSKIHAELAVGE
jgi:ATP-binding cassette subfamily B protein